MDKPRALVVDDEPDLRELLDMTLSRMGLDVVTADNLANARQALAEQPNFDLCLTDMRLPDGNGLSLVKEIQRDHENLPVAMITAFGRVEDAVTALKYGAFDFVSKPVDLESLRNLVRTALRISEDEREKRQASDLAERDQQAAQMSSEASNGGLNDDQHSLLLQRLIGDSEPIKRVRKTIIKLARSQAPVMISGESGTGKELAAHLIHDLGPRAEEPFIPVNCGAIPTELMESEFFGHVKGSFTGADSDKEGLFQAAHGGTLFLDEVADLPLQMQVKLLRVIQEKKVRPIGGRQEFKVDVRILSASHKELRPLVDSGAFRNDLYYRLNVIELNMPSLNERPGDIPKLAGHFLENIGMQWGENPPQLSDSAVEALCKHRYSGNVRELINILQRAMTLRESDSITVDDLKLGDSSQAMMNENLDHCPGDRSLDDYIEEVEARILENALREARYNKTEAARRLGITFRSLRYKLKKYGID